jgi:uncharacterized protein YdcH (DUF465 family)
MNIKTLNVKIIIVLIEIFATAVCFADDATNTNKTVQLPELRKEHHEWQGPNGSIRYRDEIYRGKERILRTVKFQNETTKAWETWQYFYIDGKAVMFESYGSDGKSQTITLIKDDQTYDKFQRRQDGSLEPLSSEELAKLKVEEQKFNGEAEKFTEVLATEIATNSTGNATQIAKEAVQKFKQEQLDKKDSDK